ncbi:putative xanthine dehydrogenase subunit A [Paraburkholderia hiiakae]|uniref:Xanthine dehydrogenase subunit A n=1 Tax=Paraburkholderia hiiakae TaxID=1081782 RepID=A0ABN7HR65_9BURK|nr:XdhC family protein [Paraburkholderia hiiakae]CAD6532692.1 putative xanthine dehydrogenase subunit A [Paraburkholderia hiiakae]
MDSMDQEVLRTGTRWLKAGHRVFLVTVVKTWGSSPRPEGAMLAIREDGAVVGSVSGGCIEDDLIAAVRASRIVDKHPSTLKYGVTAEEAWRFGLPCGGTIQLVVEPLVDASVIGTLYEAVSSGKLVSRTLDMETGAVLLADAAQTDGLHFDGQRLVTIHGPRYRMLVIGGGQLSRYLCSMAVGLDYQVTVCDPRTEYADEWDIPEIRIVRTMPDDAVLEMRLDRRCAVIALTHDPKLDDLALMEALRTEAFYVGALGSRSNNAARRERLLEFDLTSNDIARLHGPVGLYIGSRTPPEIAISILAEVTAAKNGVVVPKSSTIEGAKPIRALEAV